MNILFLTIVDFDSIKETGIYTDLMREFVRNGHRVHIVSPVEKRKNRPGEFIDNGSCKILKPKIGNIQSTGMIEKGISIVFLEGKLISAVRKYFSGIRFDLVLYSTPPVTIAKPVAFVKRRDNARTYLMLKDIFPQNAVDIGIMSKKGIGRLIFGYFRLKEKSLYRISDHIGCMSQANVDFLLKNNPQLSPDAVEVCPNSAEPVSMTKDIENKEKIRRRYGIPPERTVFIYGGNLGRPQGIDFLLECLKANMGNDRIYFVIVGWGTEYKRIKDFIFGEGITNAMLYERMPQKEYEQVANSCDAGLIFLDKRFTVPNFPSRMLSYMQSSMPVLAVTDTRSDIKEALLKGGFGLWCESGDLRSFNSNIEIMCDEKFRGEMGENAQKYLMENYTCKHAYEIIIKHFKHNKEGQIVCSKEKPC